MLGLADLIPCLLAIVSLILLVLWYSSIKLSHFKKLGIPGPKPWPILGNLLELLSSDVRQIDMKYKREHGPVVGVYAGLSPTVIIFDQELISQVMVKQFGHFTNKKSFSSNDETISEMLIHLKDDHWKHVRSKMTPAFTTKQLKQARLCRAISIKMAGEINRCSIQLAANVASNVGPFELMETCGNYSMDVMASTSCGLRVDSQNSQNNPFVLNVKKLLSFSPSSPLAIMTVLFPNLSRVFQKMFKLSHLDKNAIQFFIKVFKQTLEASNDSNEKRSDFLHLMSTSMHRPDVCSKAGENEVKQLSNPSARTGLTEKEVSASAFISIFAGYENNRLGLAMLLYCLATNPECQHKVMEEMDSILGDKESVSYEDVMQMHYLDQCMQESLRLFPPIASVARVTKRDIDISGVSFKKGTIVKIPLYALQNDPDIWTDPERFDPDRFSLEEKAKRHAMLWQPFGFGPRNCIAMRMATYQMKAAVVHILRKQTIATCERTEDPIQLKKDGKPKNNIWLAAKKRK